MTRAYAASLGDASLVPRLHLLASIHHTIGMLVLAVTLARLGWRLGNVVPGAPAGLRRAWVGLARATHACFYLLLVALPVSGYAALSRLEGFPIFFGPFHVPKLLSQLPFNDPQGYALFAGIHRWCWKVGGGILLLHLLAALWHQWVRRDGLLRRMWQGDAA
jgi:cytochrome b561